MNDAIKRKLSEEELTEEQLETSAGGSRFESDTYVQIRSDWSTKNRVIGIVLRNKSTGELMYCIEKHGDDNPLSSTMFEWNRDIYYVVSAETYMQKVFW